MDDFSARVERTITRQQLLADGARAVLGISGGVDSMVLLHTLHRLSTKHRWKLVIAHFNHRLRGDAADADERFVANTAKKFRLPFTSERQNVKVHARAHGLSVEMAARQLRHEFFARVAKRHESKHIALAHHADDQIELFFLRLFRGSGAEGLGGMRWRSCSPASRHVTLIRPLLGEPKAVLVEFARVHGIKFREDVTNRSVDILRNRIRHKLLPLLRRDYQPAIAKTISRAMRILQDEHEFLTAESNAWLSRKRRAPFPSLQVALQRRVLHLQLFCHGIAPEFEHVEELRTKPNTWVELGRGISCRRTIDGAIELRREKEIAFNENKTTFQLNGLRGRIQFGTVQFSWQLIKQSRLPSARRYTENFDANAIGRKITLRHWRAGDRFRAIGSKHAVKVQDFFVNRKIPRGRRHEMVVAAASSGKIFWIEGERIAEDFKITPKTSQILNWRWRRLKTHRSPVRVDGSS